MRADLCELLLAHRVAGAWRAPLGSALRAVPAPRGWGAARIVEAGAPDCTRARAGLRAPPAPTDPEARLRAALGAARSDILAAREAEGFGAGDALRATPLPQGAPGAGAPVLVLGTRAADPVLIAEVMVMCLCAGSAVLFKPAPRAAVSGALLVRALARAGLAGPDMAMLQGGGATGALLWRQGGWGAVLVPGKAQVRADMPGAVAVPDAAALAYARAGLTRLPLAPDPA